MDRASKSDERQDDRKVEDLPVDPRQAAEVTGGLHVRKAGGDQQ